MSNWSAQQLQAIDRVKDWYDADREQVFYLAGYAGTGKTTLARHFADNLGRSRVYYGAFTGKAAHVLRQKGCANATTLHSLMYIPKEKGRERLKLFKELVGKYAPDSATADPKKHAEYLHKLKAEEQNMMRPMFTINTESDLYEADLLIVDEVSMIDAYMGEDLLKFGCRILVLGDPAQLPPIKGAGFFTRNEPDFMLTDIHRQAKDSPIITLATMIRNQDMPKLGEYGNCLVTKDIDKDMVLGADQVIVGRNKTRNGFNKRIRTLLGREGQIPVKGDRVVCLRNNHDVGFLNGALYDLTGVVYDPTDEATISLAMSSEDGDQYACSAHMHYFLGQTPPYWDIKEHECFDYGYAMTCHKSQGSQWDDVLVYDESGAFNADRWKWLYTAVTRAAERVVVVR